MRTSVLTGDAAILQKTSLLGLQERSRRKKIYVQRSETSFPVRPLDRQLSVTMMLTIRRLSGDSQLEAEPSHLKLAPIQDAVCVPPQPEIASSIQPLWQNDKADDNEEGL